ncbi:unnamed protein product [Candida verbasci]|uniref:Nudix hydrolase domain-containing protein n=1 Tax=Candida verbasci TaxID=1227364 RepID=A0A9W4X8P3_9ASCO|nr:unnamed protein product [Candida verbasci]
MTKSTEIQLLERNLYNYIPQNYQNNKLSIWHRLPITRRSAVFILLFLGKLGELRVILTKRSSKLRNFPGHVALPGGKADNGLESEWAVSRREMFEEIGLNNSNEELKKLGLTIDHITMLPSYLSRTFSCVKPCVGLLKNLNNNDHMDLTTKLNIVLNPGESSSIFSCPLRDFLHPSLDEPSLESLERVSYKVKWGGIPWDLRSYTFLQNNPNEVEWLKDIKQLSSSETEESEEEWEKGETLDSEDKGRVTPSSLIEKKAKKVKKKNLSTWGRLGSRLDDETNEKIYDVWGLTANVLHDLSEIVYLGKDIANKRHIGEEEMIYCLYEYGNQMRQKERSEEEVKLIHATHTSDDKEFGFHTILPTSEFNRLKTLYKL